MYFIWGDYAVNFALKLGIPNWLLASNIIWNIISKKTVTEDWKTAWIKLLLYSMNPIDSISNCNCQLSIFNDFSNCLTDCGFHQELISQCILF